MKDKLFYTFITGLICITAISCANDRVARTDETLESAKKMAHRYARQLKDPYNSLTDHDIQITLLQTKAKEYQMRQYGLDEAADIFVAEFKRNVAEINDSLAQIIF